MIQFCSVIGAVLLAASIAPPTYVSAGSIGEHRNLFITNDYMLLGIDPKTRDHDYRFRVMADEVVVRSGRERLRLSDIDLIVDLRRPGLGGLDTGEMKSNTWYHIHVLGNQRGDKGAVLSASIKAPTIPEPFTHSDYFGSALFKPTANFHSLNQRGNIAVRKNETEGFIDLRGGKSRVHRPRAVIDLSVPETARVWRGMLKARKTSPGPIWMEVHPLPNYLVESHQHRCEMSTECWRSDRIPLIHPQKLYYRLIQGDGLDVETFGWEY